MCLVTAECRAQALVESESHFALRCEGYSDLRQLLYDKLTLPDNFHFLSEAEQLSTLINTPDYVKHTAQFIIDAFNQRCKMLYNSNQ